MSEKQESLFENVPEEKKTAKKSAAKKTPVEPDEEVLEGASVSPQRPCQRLALRLVRGYRPAGEPGQVRTVHVPRLFDVRRSLQLQGAPDQRRTFGGAGRDSSGVQPGGGQHLTGVVHQHRPACRDGRAAGDGCRHGLGRTAGSGRTGYGLRLARPCAAAVSLVRARQRRVRVDARPSGSASLSRGHRDCGPGRRGRIGHGLRLSPGFSLAGPRRCATRRRERGRCPRFHRFGLSADQKSRA